MEDKNKKIEFDPGFAPLVIESLGQVGYMYYMFNSIPDKKLKRLNFRVIASKLEKHLELNIAFYMGCLLWASYISEFENYEIEGADYLIKINTKNISLLDKTKIDYLYQLGYIETKKRIKKINV